MRIGAMLRGVGANAARKNEAGAAGGRQGGCRWDDGDKLSNAEPVSTKRTRASYERDMPRLAMAMLRPTRRAASIFLFCASIYLSYL